MSYCSADFTRHYWFGVVVDLLNSEYPPAKPRQQNKHGAYRQHIELQGKVRRGILPGPISDTHTWDRKAILTLLDRASSLQTPMATTNKALDEWRAKHARTP